MEDGQTKVTITAGVTKGFGRDGQYRLSLGPVVGYGRTLAEAKTDLTENVMQALTNAATDPAFARDDDGSLVVAVQDISGVAQWVVREDNKPRQISYSDGPPRKSPEGCHHFTILDS